MIALPINSKRQDIQPWAVHLFYSSRWSFRLWSEVRVAMMKVRSLLSLMNDEEREER